MITIKRLEIKRYYKYLWLKNVESADLSNHCARSLIGKYNKKISSNIRVYENIELEESKYYYLCGVYSYSNNIHLAFKEKLGEKIIIDNEFYRIEVENAEQIKIDETSIDRLLPQSRDKDFYTCRNWWFANWVNSNK